ncbi:hypothetical protein DMENIID0001_136980 [Sergentomyia squamirostris]
MCIWWHHISLHAPQPPPLFFVTVNYLNWVVVHEDMHALYGFTATPTGECITLANCNVCEVTLFGGVYKKNAPLKHRFDPCKDRFYF